MGRNKTAWLIPAALLVLEILLASVASKGLDLTDEGYYLNSIFNPDTYKYGTSSFGHWYQLQLDVFGWSIGELRTANQLLIWLCGAMLGVLAASGPVKSAPRSAYSFLSVAGLGGIAANLYYFWWLFTPSYNMLAFQGILGFAIVTVGSRFGRLNSSIIAACLGFFVFLTFIGKPTSGMMLLAIFFISKGKITLEVLKSFSILILSFVAFLWLWSIHVDGSFMQYLVRLRNGAEFLTILGAGQNILDSDFSKLAALLSPFVGLNTDAVLALVAAGLIFWVLGFRVGRLSNMQLTVFAGMAIGFVFAYLAIRGNAPLGLIIYLPLVYIIGQLCRYGKWWRSPEARLKVSLILMPLAYVAGTNNNYWFAGIGVGSLFFYAFLLPLPSDPSESKSRLREFAVSMFFLLSSLAVLIQAASFPYRQNDAAWNMEPSQSVDSLYTTQATEAYLRQIQTIFLAGGFRRGAPVIDISGQSPTAIFAVGGTPLGSVWLIGGYSGSEKFSSEVLAMHSASCLASSWIIDEPRGLFRLNPDVIQGVNFPGEFQLAGQVKSPMSGNIQNIYKPISSLATIKLDCAQK